MKSVKDQLVSAAIHSVFVITIESVFTGAAFAAIVKLIAKVAKWDPLLSTYTALAVGLLSALVLLVVLLSVRRSRVVIPFRKFDYEFILRRCTINYSDMNKPVYKRVYSIKSSVANLDRITDSFAWTGSSAKLPVCVEGNCEIRESGKSGLFTVFDIIFPSRLGKGDTKTIELRWDLENANNEAGPFISTTVTHPTKNVEMEVHLPSGAYVGPAYLTSCPHIQVRLSDTTSERAFREGYVIASLANPVLFSHIELRWRWA